MKFFNNIKSTRVAVDVAGQDAENWDKLKSLKKSNGLNRPDAIRRFIGLVTNDPDFLKYFLAKVNGTDISYCVGGNGVWKNEL